MATKHFVPFIICTLLSRPFEDGMTDVDVEIDCKLTGYIKGYHRGAHIDPGDADEFEFEFVTARYSGGQGCDASEPLTQPEIDHLRAWLTYEKDGSRAIYKAGLKIIAEEGWAGCYYGLWGKKPSHY